MKVKADRTSLANVKRQKAMCSSAPGNKNVLIIGGGPASVACAETLRQEGFKGDITIVTKDKYIPYDRIKLSKVGCCTLYFRHFIYYTSKHFKKHKDQSGRILSVARPRIGTQDYAQEE